jgi:hypothetical protein
VAGAAAGREILIGIDRGVPLRPLRLDTGLELWSSLDDGATFAPWDAGEMISALAPGPEGWYLGTVFQFAADRGQSRDVSRADRAAGNRATS